MLYIYVIYIYIIYIYIYMGYIFLGVYIFQTATYTCFICVCVCVWPRVTLKQTFKNSCLTPNLPITGLMGGGWGGVIIIMGGAGGPTCCVWGRGGGGTGGFGTGGTFFAVVAAGSGGLLTPAPEASVDADVVWWIEVCGGSGTVVPPLGMAGPIFSFSSSALK